MHRFGGCLLYTSPSRYRLTLHGKMTKNLRLLLAFLLRQFGRDGGNRGVSAFADINGYE